MSERKVIELNSSDLLKLIRGKKEIEVECNEQYFDLDAEEYINSGKREEVTLVVVE